MERRIRFLLAVGLSCAAAAGAQQAARPIALREAIRLAQERNPEVLVSRALLEELDGRIVEVRSGAFPQVAVEGVGLRLRDPSILNSSSFDRVPQEFKDALVPRAANLFDLALTVKQPIYNAGKVHNAVHLADEARKEKQSDLEGTRQRVAFKVFQAFHDLLLAQESIRVITETREQREKHLAMAKSRFASGVATEIDVLRSEVNLANTEPELIRARNRIRQARALLNSLIVVDLEAPTEAAGTLEPRLVPLPPLEQLQAEGLRARPELESARRAVEQSRLLVTLARSENKVGVDFDARLGYSVREPKNFFSSDFSRWNMTFNLRLPIYDGGRKEGLLAQALARLRAAEQNLALKENGVRLEIKAARDDMESAAQAIASAGLAVTQAEKVLVMMQANYRYGAATTLDVVDSQAAMTVARNTRIGAWYDFDLALARVRLATGRTVVDDEEKP